MIFLIAGILIGTVAVVSLATKFPMTIGDDEY